MKKFKKPASLILALCLVFALAVSACADNNITASGGSGTTPVSLDFDELSRRAEAASEKCSALTEKLKATEARMSEVEELKKQVINYLRTRETFRAYKASGYSKRYLAEHEQEILLHRAAKKAFNDLGLKKLPTVKALQAEYAALLTEKRATYPAYREARAEMKKLLTYRANAEAILNVDAKADGRQKEHEQR